MTPEQRKSRGIAARALLGDDTIREGWAEIENSIRDEWENCILPRKRDRLWAELRHIKRLRHRLAIYAGHAPLD